MRVLIALLFALPLLGQPIVIDAGGPGDAGFSSGTATYTVPANLMPVTILPPGTNDATMRYAPAFSYHVTVANPGLYTVSLYFVEPTYQSPGQRIMSVTANDTPILQGVDLAAEAGYLVPTAKTAIVAIAGLDLYLQFSALGGRNALVSEMIVTPIAALSQVQTCTGSPNCAGLGFAKLTGTLTGSYWLVPVTSGWTPTTGNWTLARQQACDLGVIPPANGFLAGLQPGINYLCGSYNLQTLANFGVTSQSCDVYLNPPSPCMVQDVASTAWGVINQRCTRCHGADGGWTDTAGAVHQSPPDSKLTWAATDGALVGGLDLRTKAAMLQGGGRGPALRPGDPITSLIYLYTALSDTDAPLVQAGPGMISTPNTPSVQYVANLDALDLYLHEIGIPDIPSLSGSGTEGPLLSMPPFAPLQPAEIEALANWIRIGAPDATPAQ